MTDAVVGHYRVGALIGSGGTADVFAAVDVRSGRTVALKLLHERLSLDTARWDAFFEEVRAARAVDHPGIPTIEDWGVEPGEPPLAWIAMERVVGTTLSAYVREHGALDPVAAVAVADALLAVADAAHAQHVVHRDVTPANVMFDPDAAAAAGIARSVRLLDFGLADIPGRSTAGGDVLLSGAVADAGAVIASVPFASPEHLRGDPVTEASDLYQIAATLFFALTGTTVFSGDTDAQRAGHLSAAPPSLADRGAPGMPELDAVVRKALRKDAPRRFPAAAVMRQALRDVLLTEVPTADLPVVVREPRPATELTRVLPSSSGIMRTAALLPPVIPVAPVAQPAVRIRARRLPAWGAALAGAVAITAIIAVAATATPTAGPGGVAASPTATASSTPTATPTATATPADLVSVPNVAGLSLGDATARLEAAGFRRGDLAPVDGADAADTVLGSNPGSGSQVSRGSRIALRVATGRNAVPATAGVTVSEAVAILRAAGFDVDVVGDAQDVVASTSPGAGEVLPHGARVTVQTPLRSVPSAPQPTPTSVRTPTATPTPLPTEGAIP